MNKSQPIQAACYYGRQRNEKCQHEYHGTNEIPILCHQKVRVLFTPITKCTIHNQINKLYAYKDDEERLTLGQNDRILNKMRWWICPAFSEKKSNRRHYFASRYCITDTLLSDLIDHVIRLHGSPVEWCKTKRIHYAEWARQVWINKGERYKNLNKQEMEKEIKSYFGVDTIKKIVSEIGIGYIRKCNQQADELLYRDHWIEQYHLDGSHQTLNHICVTQKGNPSKIKFVLKASQARITNHMSLQLGETCLLEKGREPISFMFGYQLPKIISNNMKLIKSQPKQFLIHAQNDTATHNNAENIRNILIEGIKEELNMDQDTYMYQNPNGIQFDFREFKFILSQESMHEYHRQNNLKAFKIGHPDAGYMRKDLRSIIYNTRLSYDPVLSPYHLECSPNLTNYPFKYYAPYDIVKHEQCSFLFRNENFYVVSRGIKALIMNKKTRKQPYKDELRKYLEKKYTNGLGRYKIRKALRYICKHTPPYLICAVISVK